MAELLDAGLDLAGLAACYVAIALLTLAAGVVAVIDQVVPNPSIGIPHVGSWRPLNFLHDAINATLNGLQAALHGVDTAAAKFQSGLLDSVTLLIGIPLLIAVGIYDAFVLLWSHALEPRIRAVMGDASSIASKAAGDVSDLARRVEQEVTGARSYAEAQATKALADAKAYTATNLLAGIGAAERYADEAVSKIRAGEDAAIASASKIATAARDAAETAGREAAAAAQSATSAALAAVQPAVSEAQSAAARAAGAVSGVESAAVSAARAAAQDVAGAAAATASAAVSTAVAAEQEAAQALAVANAAVAAAADAATKSALDEVRAIAIDARDAANSIPDLSKLAEAAALLASIPALATIVNAIASEAGLENASCRTKVKGICGADPARWTGLLAGIAAFGTVFSLRQIVEAASTVIEDARPLITDLAG